MFVIVRTDNRQRGDDAITGVFGPFKSEAEALEINAELRADLPAHYSSHEDNPIDYGVWEIQALLRECGGCGRINNYGDDVCLCDMDRFRKERPDEYTDMVADGLIGEEA